jgi:hypothetical protein
MSPLEEVVRADKSRYPNRTFTALVPGTLVIRYVLETRGL